jgi:hypothetical protein
MLTGRMQKYESVHVLFWLIKDSCWMLELKLLGTVVMVPTVIIAAYIVFKTRKSTEMYVNLAIFFWILANSFWMTMEFFYESRHKDLAGIPFILGFIFVSIYFYITMVRKRSDV